MKLIEQGGIYCNKSGCHTKMHLEGEKCPKCGNVKCFIVLYWEGKTYTYRRDDNGKVFRVFTVVRSSKRSTRRLRIPKFLSSPRNSQTHHVLRGSLRYSFSNT